MEIDYEKYKDILTAREISFLKKNGSLADKYPQSIQFWDFERNGILTPNVVTPSSSRIVFWHCRKCNYKWDASIVSRAKAENCPVCSGRIVVKGINDFATKFNDIASEWDDEIILDYNPTTVTSYSHKMGYWRCKLCGNKWSSTFENRANGQGCKKCGYEIVGEKVIERSLFTRGSLLENCQDIMLDWNYDKNIGIDPNKITIASRAYVWWKCHICGHEWQAVVGSRTTGHKNGCPECNRHNIKSHIQTLTEDYIKNNYHYILLHEFGCTIVDTNPLTNKKMPYDNELIIGDKHLIIEVNGIQHYDITNFSKFNAIRNGITPEKSLFLQKQRDDHKMKYVLSFSNYYYLAIPYWNFEDESYKEIINSTISEILQDNTKLLPKEELS